MCAGDARGDKKGTYPAATATVGCVLKQTLIGGKQLKKALCVEKKESTLAAFSSIRLTNAKFGITPALIQ